MTDAEILAALAGRTIVSARAEGADDLYGPETLVLVLDNGDELQITATGADDPALILELQSRA